MGKFKTVYVCQQCGAQTPKWAGQCPNCKAWNSLVEEIQETRNKRQGTKSHFSAAKTVRLSELQLEKGHFVRRSTGSSEFDRVLGGGIVPGSVVLIAGEPGIGKSTLLTQLAMRLGGKVLYVCGEESPEQVGIRVQRLAQTQSEKLKSQSENLSLLASNDVDQVIEAANQEKPDLMIVDSIQTMTTGDLLGMAGSVGQVRECTGRLIQYAKGSRVPIFVVGHVTKEGSVAGPKVLEHMVDSVLAIEGEKTGLWRILRAYKNRFGATDEVGVFTMAGVGLQDVANPSGVFLEESQAGKPGSAIAVVMEGTRPVLLEIQALVVPSVLANPRRVAQGIPIAKVQVITAVLTRHCRLHLANQDIFVSVAGGVTVREPAADLAVTLAVASAMTGKVLGKSTVAIGEVGLLGEVRRVTNMERRVKEAKALGYDQVLSPETVKYVNQAVRQMAR